MIIQDYNQVRKYLVNRFFRHVDRLFLLISGRRDSSGIRFFLSNELRPQELGFLTLGTSSSVKALAIPPKVDNFIIDSYCLPEATQVSNFSLEIFII